LLVIGLAAGGWWFFSRKSHVLTDKDTIVLADFTNATGDTVFDGTLRQGLNGESVSPFWMALRVAAEKKQWRTRQCNPWDQCVFTVRSHFAAIHRDGITHKKGAL
jgi:hypothetical protein